MFERMTFACNGSGIFRAWGSKCTGLLKRHPRWISHLVLLAALSSGSSLAAGLPSAPTNIRVIPGNQEATVAFTPPKSNGGSPITGYVVTANPVKGTVASGNVTKGAASPIYVSGLPGYVNPPQPNTFAFTVAAINANGVGPASLPVESDLNNGECSATVPGCSPKPPAITGVKPGNGQATVAFNPVNPLDSGGSPIVSYTVEASPGNASATGTASPIVVTGLSNGTAYTFTVTATNKDTWGTMSNPSGSVMLSGPPGSPTINAVIPGNGQATVAFTAPNTNGGSPITRYTVTVNPGNITVRQKTSPITVRGLNNGTTYTATITATNASGTGAPSAASNSFTPGTAPNAPSIGNVTLGNGQATVAVNSPSNNGGSPIIYYTVTAQPGGSSASGPSPVTVPDLARGTQYTFTATATNGFGTSAPSAPSQSYSAITVPAAPRVSEARPGDLDMSFGGPGAGGVLKWAEGNTTYLSAIAVQNDDKILVVASPSGATRPNNLGLPSFFGRATADGGIDASFGEKGIPYLPEFVRIYAVMPLSNGKIIVAGNKYKADRELPQQDPQTSFFVARYNPDGTIDNSFGSNKEGTTDKTGWVVTSIGDSDSAKSIAVQADGKLLVAGYTLDESRACTIYSFAVVRYTSDGQVDKAFAGKGFVTYGPKDCSYFVANNVAIQDGNILVAGESLVQDGTVITLVRYRKDGSMDTSFGSNGVVTTDFSPSGYVGRSIPSGMAVQTDGKIVVAGTYGRGNSVPTNVNIVRYLQNGMLDTDFGNGGIVNGVDYSFISGGDVLVQRGRIIAGAAVRTNIDIQKYASNGAADVNFGNAGVAEIGTQELRRGGPRLALQRNGKIVVASNLAKDYPSSVEVYRLQAGAAIAGNGQATITFGAPEDNGGSTITNYTVTAQPGGMTATGTASPITVTGLTNGTAYTFVVTATNAAGTSAPSAASNSVIPTSNDAYR